MTLGTILDILGVILITTYVGIVIYTSISDNKNK